MPVHCSQLGTGVCRSCARWRAPVRIPHCRFRPWRLPVVQANTCTTWHPGRQPPAPQRPLRQPAALAGRGTSGGNLGPREDPVSHRAHQQVPLPSGVGGGAVPAVENGRETRFQPDPLDPGPRPAQPSAPSALKGAPTTGELVTDTLGYRGGRQITVYVPPDPRETVVFAADGGWHTRRLAWRRRDRRRASHDDRRS